MGRVRSPPDHLPRRPRPFSAVLLRLPRQSRRLQPLRPVVYRLPLRLDLGPDCCGLLLPLSLFGSPRLSPSDGCAVTLVHVRSSGCEPG